MSEYKKNEKKISIAGEILGYLNFSSGASDPHLYDLWNGLYFELEREESGELWKRGLEYLKGELVSLSKESAAFRDSKQADSVLTLISEKLLPAYLEFHHDLLFHQSGDFLFNPFFMARLCELTLRQSTLFSGGDEKKLVQTILAQANDFLGYRPIPILEGEEKHEPNPHEWVAPVPVWLPQAGAAHGKYRDLIRKTIEILKSTDPVLLRDAWFDPDKLDELAIDPRAFDFDHPVNRRPNYYFGTWDPHTIDKNGYYRRFIIHQVTLDAILERVAAGGRPQTGAPGTAPNLRQPADRPWDQLLYEAAAVLAGTILMGSGVTGDHVQAHDSTVTLGALMSVIASYRDRFYDFLLQNLPEAMRPRMEAEARQLFQPFGGARQDLNKRLAKKRADQLQRFHLARVFARMGYFKAAEKQTAIISVASARIVCRIECLLTEGYLLADRGDYKTGVQRLNEIEEFLHRGIDCGALPDPWSLLGFGAQYSIFSPDDAVHDHRVDDMINMLVDIFDLYSRLMKEAAAKGDSESQSDISDSMSELAGWWDQFGSTEVSGIDGFSGMEIWESATKVASALYMWQKAGNKSGDVSFWSRHLQRFHSPKAFVLLGEALLEKNDPVATMALMMYWLSRAESIPLAENDYTFQGMAFRWMETLWGENRKTAGEIKTSSKSQPQKSVAGLPPDEYERRWKLTKAFLERLEANAGLYAEVPTLEVDPILIRPKSAPNGQIPLPPGMKKISEFELKEEDVPPEMKNFVENIMNRSSFTLFDLIDEDWMREKAKQDSWFKDFASQPLTSGEIPAFIEFLRKCLIRVLVKRLRTDLAPDEVRELLREADLLHRIIGEILSRTGFMVIDRILWEFRKRIGADPEFDMEKLPEIDETFFTEKPDEKTASDEPLPDDPEQTNSPDWLFKRYLCDFLKQDEWAEIRRTLVNPDTDDFELPQFKAADNLEEITDRFGFPSSDGEDDDQDDEDAFDSGEFTEEDSDDAESSEFGRELFGDSPDFENSGEEEDDDEDDDVGIDPTYSAAYDNMSFHDSADDGIDDEMIESDGAALDPEDELTAEMDRINDRLSFIFSVMKLWKYAAGKSPLLVADSCSDEDVAQTRGLIEDWIKTAEDCRQKLEELLVTVGNYRIANPNGTSQSLLEYDQQHGTKEILLDRIIRTEVEVNDTILFLCAVVRKEPAKTANLPEWIGNVTRVMSGLIHADVDQIRSAWLPMLTGLEKETLLYIPTSRGGEPGPIVRCRCLQQAILRLFEYLPILGLLIETFELLRTVQKMEQNRPEGPGAITEFDKIVETAVASITKMIADSSTSWRMPSPQAGLAYSAEQALVTFAERAINVLLGCWLSHSAHIRISSVESIAGSSMWSQVKAFIQRYGTDLFTQQFLNFRNIRAILHQGGAAYLQSLMKMYQNGEELENGELLISDLAEKRFPLASAAACLEVIFEAIAENYSEYVDYNSTTTQSDHGEKLYMLLDMFRVLTKYERVAWNLKPVYWAHQILIRSEHLTAATLWEKGIAARSNDAANESLASYQKLSTQYGVWLPSIYERLAERFVRPLQIARLCGLVSDAIRDAPQGESSESFRKLEETVEQLAKEQSGIGFELPEWLSALQEEVIRIQDSLKMSKSESDASADPQNRRPEDAFNPMPVVRQVFLPRRELERQINWCRKNIDFGEK
ncbi:MAG: hypothetical protein J6S40_01000 [Thermoguttaceae bacterium]|nr:hypothetical protein [Thermoguttaceae bacterium]